MFGTNRRIKIIETTRTISDSGAVGEDMESVVATHVPAAIQAHVLNNLPPPDGRPAAPGILDVREYRCWIATASIPLLTPHTTWIIEDENPTLISVGNGEQTEFYRRFRVVAVIDDAGRSHHWLLRLEEYNG